jgi:hypothetical protein
MAETASIVAWAPGFLTDLGYSPWCVEAYV